jgi:hypothetical protein
MKIPLLLLLASLPLHAGEADVTAVSIDCNHDNTCTLSVTVQHNDEGWDHYADRWEVLNAGGGEIAARTRPPAR